MHEWKKKNDTIEDNIKSKDGKTKNMEKGN
jgi:hypothetical protein